MSEWMVLSCLAHAITVQNSYNKRVQHLYPLSVRQSTACLTMSLLPMVLRLSTTVEAVPPLTACPWDKGISTTKISIGRYISFAHHTEYLLFATFIHTSYVTPLSVPASQGIRSATSFWTQPQSLVQRSSPDSPTFQSGLGPSMVRKDMRWRFWSTENSADGAARLVVRPVNNDKHTV